MMLQDRLFGAFSFKQGTYYEVEHDETFTTTAWILVIVAALLNQIGNFASSDYLNGFAGAVGATIAEVVAFAIGCFLIYWIGKNFFNAEVTFGEMVRTLGLAHVWRALGVLGLVSAIIPGLTCIVWPVLLLATLLGFAAWFVAAKEALDLELGQTIITVVIGFIGFIIVVNIITAILGLLGFSSAIFG